MRSTASIGMMLRFWTDPSPKVGDPAMRRPSSSTNVLSEPIPRRLMADWDWAELPDLSLNEPIWFMLEPRNTSEIETSPVASISARVITVTGCGASMSTRRMREPVTTTIPCSAMSSSSSCASAVFCISKDAAAADIVKAARIDPVRFSRFISSPPTSFFDSACSCIHDHSRKHCFGDWLVQLYYFY